MRKLNTITRQQSRLIRIHLTKNFEKRQNHVRRLFIETKILTEKLEEKQAKDLLKIIHYKILKNAEASDIMLNYGGIKKLHIVDPARRKDTRGGLRLLFPDLPAKRKPT